MSAMEATHERLILREGLRYSGSPDGLLEYLARLRGCLILRDYRSRRKLNGRGQLPTA